MSILKRMNGIPVYTNINEALEWGRSNNMLGYHVHKHMSVTGYMGGRNHADMPLRFIELPIKTKGKPGYKPKIGSRVISTIAGESTSIKVTAKTTYDRKGFPILEEENKVESVEQVVNALPIRVVPNVRNVPAPIANRIPIPTTPILRPTAARTSSAGSSGYSGGGGY